MVLFGDPNRRYNLMTLEWPEEEGTMIEGKKRIELDDTEPLVAECGNGAIRNRPRLCVRLRADS